jgi:hypothetical protein
MSTYILTSNQQANGDHEVHGETLGCTFVLAPENPH